MNDKQPGNEFLSTTECAALYILGQLALHGHLTRKQLDPDEFPALVQRISIAIQEALPYLDLQDIPSFSVENYPPKNAGK